MIKHDNITVRKHAGVTLKSPLETYDFVNRVTTDGGTVENLAEVNEVLNRPALNESIVLVPSGVKATKLHSQKPTNGISDFTVARASVATRINSQNLIETMADDVARIDYKDCVFTEIEPESINIIPRSEDFILGWNGTYTTTADQAIAPDGTMTADLVQPIINDEDITAGDGDKLFEEISGFAFGDYTNSLYVKATDGTTFDMALHIVQRGTGVSVSYTVITVTDKWQRVHTTGDTTGATNNGCRFHIKTERDIYLWGAQISQTTQLTRYVPTFNGINAGIPPLYSHTGKPALLLEPESENLTSYSQELDNAYYQKANGSTLTNIAISPDGALNADAYIEDTSTNTHDFYKFNYIVVTAVPYTFSFFVKKKGNRNIRLTSQSGANYFANFDLTLGEVVSVSSATATIEDVGNGWFRCSITGTPTAGNMGLLINSLDGTSTNYLGDGASGLYMYGLQIEQSEYPTTYISTTTVAVTRAADLVTDSGNPAYINSEEGTLFMEWAALDSVGVDGSLVIDNGTDYQILIRHVSIANGLYVRSLVLGVGDAISYTIPDITLMNKIAVLWDSSNLDLWVNGVKVATQPRSNTFPLGALEGLHFTDRFSTRILGRFRQVRVIKGPMTDEQMEHLTSYRSFEEMADELNYNVV